MSRVITQTPIAYINSQFSQNTPPEEMRREPSKIIVEPDYRPGLMGLQPGQDLLIIFYFHKIDPAEIHLQLHPRHDPENPLTGVFNTRTQFRPNQLGATVVHLEQVAGHVLTVSGLDAQDGAPVLDIKPFAPFFDAATRDQQFETIQVSSLQEAREKIDLIDAEVIRLLGNRAGYVQQVANFKQRPQDVPAPARYAEVIRQRREWAAEAGLNPDLIEEMYKRLIDHFIEEEKEIIRRREG